MSAGSNTDLKQAERPSLEVFVLYDDPDSGRRAKALYDHLMAGFGEELRGEVKLWRFDLLKLPESREQMRTDADARLLVVAVKARTSLPDGFTEWLETWAKHRTHEDAALAVLPVGPTPPDRPTPPQIVGALRQAAERRGLTFFCSVDPAESDGAQRATPGAHREARGFRPTLGDLRNAPQPWDHCGLNE